jgi:GNAT superfamily N-acetyltransferase
MSQFTSRVLSVLKTEGVIGLTHRIRGRFRGDHRYVVVTEPVDEVSAEVPRPSIDLEITELSESDDHDIETVAGSGFYGHTRADILGHLADGQQCFVAKHQGEVVAYFWRKTGAYYNDSLYRRFDLDDDEEYRCASFVQTEFRGMGIMPYLFVVASRERTPGCRPLRGVGTIHLTNKAMIRATHKAGTRIAGRVGFIEIFGIRFHYLYGRNALPKTTKRFFLQIR